MPGKVDEYIWSKAKDAFKKQYKKDPSDSKDFAIITYIYKNMGGEFKSEENKMNNIKQKINNLYESVGDKVLSIRSDGSKMTELDYAVYFLKNNKLTKSYLDALKSGNKKVGNGIPTNIWLKALKMVKPKIKESLFSDRLDKLSEDKEMNNINKRLDRLSESIVKMSFADEETTQDAADILKRNNVKFLINKKKSVILFNNEIDKKNAKMILIKQGMNGISKESLSSDGLSEGFADKILKSVRNDYYTRATMNYLKNNRNKSKVQMLKDLNNRLKHLNVGNTDGYEEIKTIINEIKTMKESLSSDGLSEGFKIEDINKRLDRLSESIVTKVTINKPFQYGNGIGTTTKNINPQMVNDKRVDDKTKQLIKNKDSKEQKIYVIKSVATINYDDGGYYKPSVLTWSVNKNDGIRLGQKLLDVELKKMNLGVKPIKESLSRLDTLYESIVLSEGFKIIYKKNNDKYSPSVQFSGTPIYTKYEDALKKAKILQNKHKDLLINVVKESVSERLESLSESKYKINYELHFFNHKFTGNTIDELIKNIKKVYNKKTKSNFDSNRADVYISDGNVVKYNWTLELSSKIKRSGDKFAFSGEIKDSDLKILRKYLEEDTKKITTSKESVSDRLDSLSEYISTKTYIIITKNKDDISKFDNIFKSSEFAITNIRKVSTGYENTIVASLRVWELIKKHLKNDKKQFKINKESMSDRLDSLSEALSLSLDDMKQISNKLKTSIKQPYVKSSFSTLGDKDRASILLTVSKEDKKDWNGGYLENSSYARFHIGNDGSIEMFSGYLKPWMRKSRFKNENDLIKKLNDYLDKAQSK